MEVGSIRDSAGAEQIMGHPLIMLALYFHQFHLFVLERDMYVLSHLRHVPTLWHDLRSAPLPIRGLIYHRHYWRAIATIARGCCG